MPDSALTEEAGITPDGNVLAANARVTIGVDVTEIAGRMAGQLPLFHPCISRPEGLHSHGKDGKGSFPTRGVIVDAHSKAQSLLASLQSGWERGRRAEVRDSEATVGGQETAGGGREAPQEEA
jgi:hypothetical protein